MRWRTFAKVSVPAVLAVCMALSLTAQSANSGRAAVCVVAVRDSGLFTMCPSSAQVKKWGYLGRTQSLEIIQNPDGPRLVLPRHLLQLDRPVLDRSRAAWWQIIGNAPGLCPSGVMDLDLKKEIEEEFSQRDDYRLVNSPEKADLVFLAEGIYADLYSGFIGAPSVRSRPSGNPVPAVIMAIAVPAAVYAQAPADTELLLEARLWEGAEAWKSNPPEPDRQPASGPASCTQLVRRFLNRKDQKQEFPALCAPRIQVPAVDGLGAPRTRPDLMTGESGPPGTSRILPGISPAGGVIKINVSLVNVPTLVSDAAGRYVPNLSAGDFHVFEEGVEQHIDRIIPEVTPFHVALMLDTSGSTLFNHGDIQQAALAFVEALRPEDSVMVLSFDSYIYLDAAFTRDRAALRRAILKTDTGAGTRLYDALDVVISECLNRVEGRKAIVLFTDGIDTHSWLARFGNYRDRVEESDALLYAVQFDVTAGRPASQYLKGLSENSGGRLFAASTISSLAESFAEVSEELQHQYTICYYPSAQNNDAAFRHIRVTVDRPGAKIRARTGYRVSADPAAKH
jgi:Ca-activated chloride channel family protein